MAMDITALRLMELKDVKVSRMISDSADAEPTYDNPVDLAGALSFQVSPELENKILYGDSTIMDSYSRTTSINFTVTNSVVSLSGLEVIMGGQITRAGADKAETVIYELTAKMLHHLTLKLKVSGIMQVKLLEMPTLYFISVV